MVRKMWQWVALWQWKNSYPSRPGSRGSTGSRTQPQALSSSPNPTPLGSSNLPKIPLPLKTAQDQACKHMSLRQTFYIHTVARYLFYGMLVVWCDLLKRIVRPYNTQSMAPSTSHSRRLSLSATQGLQKTNLRKSWSTHSSRPHLATEPSFIGYVLRNCVLWSTEKNVTQRPKNWCLTY